MPSKSDQLQIRVAPRQKALLKRRAAAAGLDVSTYVLQRVLPPESERFAEILRALSRGSRHRFALAELSDFLRECDAGAFPDAVAHAEFGACTSYMRNYVAAMVEQTAALRNVEPPAWTRDIEPLDAPHFATPLVSLRAHLLRAAPIPFKRRNIFVDATVGDRV